MIKNLKKEYAGFTFDATFIFISPIVAGVVSFIALVVMSDKEIIAIPQNLMAILYIPAILVIRLMYYLSVKALYKHIRTTSDEDSTNLAFKVYFGMSWVPILNVILAVGLLVHFFVLPIIVGFIYAVFQEKTLLDKLIR